MDNKKHRILRYDFCKDVASKCKNATALMNFDQPVYNKSRKTGWLYDFYPKTTNLKKMIDIPKKWKELEMKD